VAEIETESRIPVWRSFVFQKWKYRWLYLGREMKEAWQRAEDHQGVGDRQGSQ